MGSFHLIGSRDAARLIGVSRSAFNRMVHSGRATPRIRLNGRTGALLFDREEIEKLRQHIAQNKNEVGAAA